MNYDETIKLAYGIGCISELHQRGVDPVAFCKTAASSDSAELLKMADAVASVYNYSEAQPAYAEKVASVVFAPVEKTAGMQDILEAALSGVRRGKGVASDMMHGPMMRGPQMAHGIGEFAGANPLAAAGIGAAGMGALGAGGYGIGQGIEAMQEDPPWYQQAYDQAGSGLNDLLGR